MTTPTWGSPDPNPLRYTDHSHTLGEPARTEPTLEDRAEAASRARPLAHSLGAASSWSYGAALRGPSDWEQWGGTPTEQPDEVAPILMAAEEHTKRLAEWPGIVKELYGSIYDPSGLKPVEAGKRHALAGELSGALEAIPQWPEIRAAGHVTRSLAAAGTVDVANDVARALGIDKLPENNGTEEDPADLDTEIAGLEAFRAGSQAPSKDLEKAIQDLQARKKKAEARRNVIRDRLADAQKTGKLSGALAHTAQVAKDRAEAAMTLRACGLGPDPATGVDPLDLALVDSIRQTPNLRQILLMLGRMRRAAHAKAPEAPVDGGRLIPLDVRQTSVLTDLLAQEWAIEGEDPDLFDRRWLDKETLGLAREGQEPRERGDLLILVDRSGSMTGGRIQWARAVAGAAMVEAVKDHRKVALVLYGGTGDHDSQVVAGMGDLGDGLRLLGKGAGGGTDTADALRHGLTLIGKLRQPDVLIVTDGEWPDLDDALIAEVGSRKARLNVVLLEGAAKIKGANRVWSIPTLSVDKATEIIHEVTR